MSELRRLLDDVQRQVRARPDALEGVYARYRRRRRTRRIAAGATTVTGTLATIAVAVAAFALISAPPVTAPGSPVIDATNVTRLAAAWSVPIGGNGATMPTIADGIVYVADDGGTLHALDARTGATIWVGITQAGAPTTPVVANDIVLVHVRGTLYAFDVGCESRGATCQPRWAGKTGGGNEAAPAVSAGVAYVSAFPGGLTAFPLGCPAAQCEPLWEAPDATAHYARVPAVGDGLIWDTSAHALSAYPVGCATGGATCTPLIHDVRPGGADLSSGPALADGTVYVGASDGTLYALSTACADGGGCEPLWLGRTGGGIMSTPTVADDRVFVGSNDGRLYVFPASCGSSGLSCDPLWIGETNGPIAEPALVANGLAYVASTDGSLYVFSEACGSTGERCAPLAVETLSGRPSAPSTWAARVVYVVSADGTITALTVDGAPI